MLLVSDNNIGDIGKNQSTQSVLYQCGRDLKNNISS